MFPLPIGKLLQRWAPMAPTNAQGIYDLLVGDVTIAQGLGTYRLANGAEMPAIAVLGANQRLPEGTTVTGIEVVIQSMPTLSPEWLLGYGYRNRPTWRIYVVQWGMGDLQGMAERVIALLPGAGASSLVSGTAVGGMAKVPGDDIGVMDQVVVTWSNDSTVVSAGASVPVPPSGVVVGGVAPDVEP
jgi:hypothetical protein